MDFVKVFGEISRQNPDFFKNKPRRCRNKVKVKTCFAGGMSPGDITSPLAAKIREACAPPTGEEFPLKKCWFYIVPLLRTPQDA